jgi:hypothetical protein
MTSINECAAANSENQQYLNLLSVFPVPRSIELANWAVAVVPLIAAVRVEA